MADRVTPFPARRPGQPGGPAKSGEADARVLRFSPPPVEAPREDGAPSLHGADVVVAGANPLLNALAALAELRAGRQVIVAAMPGADDWAYELGLQASFHRFVDAAAETLYALDPKQRLDFRHTPFPRPDRDLLFVRLRERRRRILDADAMRIDSDTALVWDGGDAAGVRLRLAAAPPPAVVLAAEHAALAEAEGVWSVDIPRAVFDAAPGVAHCIDAKALVVTSAGAVFGLMTPPPPSVRLLGSALGPYSDAAARESRAFDDVLAAIRPMPLA